MSHILNPITFPLSGTRLIEASAGTGKTYTIAALYLRLVLGHGGVNGFSRALAPPEILVVTFTNAATEELKDRIRRRLSEAAAFFRGKKNGISEEGIREDSIHEDGFGEDSIHEDVFGEDGIRDDIREDGLGEDGAGEERKGGSDPFLQELRNEYPPEMRAEKADLLDMAAQWMDEAAIHTIHSWCQRMLRQHAFDSGSLFDMDLLTDDSELLENSACDYWRVHFYSRTKEEIAELKSLVPLSNPLDLLRRVKPLLRLHTGSEKSRKALTGDIPDPFDLLAKRRLLVEHARHIWQDGRQSAFELVSKAREDKTLKGNQYSSASLEKWLNEIAVWIDKKDPFPSEKAILKLSSKGLAAGTAKNRETPAHSAFDAFDELISKLEESPWLSLSNSRKFQFLLYSHAAEWISENVRRSKERLGVTGFDDMLTRLERALRGSSDRRLAELIAAQYPVAMIDEFQDTDPVQYGIFSSIYLGGADRALLMIGDPKQAIYAFRGADIFTYLSARGDSGENLYTLEKNFRSSLNMVDSVNTIFSHAEERAERGAFFFKEQIPFEPVKSNGRDECFVLIENRAENLEEYQDHSSDGCETVSVKDGINICRFETDFPLKKGGEDGYISLMAESFADRIAEILNLASSSPCSAGFVSVNEEAADLSQLSQFSPFSSLSPVIRRVKSSDIAILVRSYSEAEAIRGALYRRNVKTVYLSDSDSVFESQEAESLLYILRACSEPSDDFYLRSALGTELLDLSLEELDELNRNEDAWESQAERFRNYLRIWRNQGVLPMIRKLLFDFDIPARLLLSSTGERKLTNILHLSEILQSASLKTDGEQALVRWFAKEIYDQVSRESSEERILRLESDDELVRVVTIHKSKGLEYPLVFLPFICSFRAAGSGGVATFHDDSGELRVVPDPDTSDIEIADRERLAEDMRMLYVALTRSIHACWLGVAVIGRTLVSGEKSELHRSAFGYLLGGGEPILSSELAERLEELKKGSEHISIEILQKKRGSIEIYKKSGTEDFFGAARTFTGVIPARWWITSYSGMVAGAGMAPSAEEEMTVVGGINVGSDGNVSDGSGLSDSSFSDSTFPVGAFPDGTFSDNFSSDKSFSDKYFSDRYFSDGVIPSGAPDSPELDQIEEYASEPFDYIRIRESDRTIHRFPKGAEPGTFLHDLMEWAAVEGFKKTASDRSALFEKISRLCAGRGFEGWEEFLTGWFINLLDAPLCFGPLCFRDDEACSEEIPERVALSDLSSEECMAEMEFMFEVNEVDTRAVDGAIHRYIMPGMARPVLGRNTLNGMVKGFIDLLFCHRGRYFIVDYKSNHLGPDIGAYTSDSMKKAILEHRYDLQYVIYSLALHRLLRSRLGDDYDYDLHTGGSIYLFLRGIDSGSQDGDKPGCCTGVYYDKPPFELIDMLDRLFASEGEDHEL